MLRFGSHDRVGDVFFRRDRNQRVRRTLLALGRHLDIHVDQPGYDGPAQIDIKVARLTRRLGALARRGGVQRLVGEVEVQRRSPAPRARTRDDLDARPIPAAVGPQRRRVDVDLGDLVRVRQTALVPAVDDEAGRILLEVAARIRAGEQHQVLDQILFIGWQRQQFLVRQRLRGQARQRVEPQRVGRVDLDIERLFPRLERQTHRHWIGTGGRRDHLVHRRERRHRDPHQVLPGRHAHAEAAVGAGDRFRDGVRRVRAQHEDDGARKHAAGLVDDQSRDLRGQFRL